MRDLQIVIDYMPVLLAGAETTLLLSSLALVIGTVLGLVVGLMRSSRGRILGGFAAGYVHLLRSVPILLILFFIYYALPLLTRIDVPSYPAAVAGLSLYCSAYMAEVVKTGVEAVQRGQWEAAHSLGMRFPAVLRYVVLPQALRIALPPAVSVYVFTIKDSALASVIGYRELTGSGVAVREAEFGQGALAVLLTVAAMYFVICYTVSLVGQTVERRIRI